MQHEYGCAPKFFDASRLQQARKVIALSQMQCTMNGQYDPKFFDVPIRNKLETLYLLLK